ncbi:MAG: hypothetical protein JWN77_254 [Frankiales bacterium]|jgi:hypothetical protein|nr:hypothetical protein [Frankiales bacterium]
MSPSETGFRARLRRTPGGALLLKVVVLLLGALFVGLGLALVVLPGPLTIPPVLLGVYIWSTEFAWAERLRDRVTDSAREAWAKARRRPVSSAVVTGAGLLLVAAALVAVRRYDVVDRVTGSFG